MFTFLIGKNFFRQSFQNFNIFQVPNIRVANESRELILNCCTEFIHLISSEANEICNQKNKKTISAEHILEALDKLGFSDFKKTAMDVLVSWQHSFINKASNNTSFIVERLQTSGSQEASTEHTTGKFGHLRRRIAATTTRTFRQSASTDEWGISNATNWPANTRSEEWRGRFGGRLLNATIMLTWELNKIWY